MCNIYKDGMYIEKYRAGHIEIFQTLILILQGIENLTSVLVHHVHFAF